MKKDKGFNTKGTKSHEGARSGKKKNRMDRIF
jgi:hypothetical protein